MLIIPPCLHKGSCVQIFALISYQILSILILYQSLMIPIFDYERHQHFSTTFMNCSISKITTPPTHAIFVQTAEQKERPRYYLSFNSLSFS